MTARRRALGLVSFVAALGLVGTIAGVSGSQPAPITGVVIDLAGTPIPGATVSMGTRTTQSDDAGSFAINDAPGEGWVRADAAGYLPRLRPARAAGRLVLRLTPDDGQTITLTFGGDVMFGRRFFDPNQDGDLRDGQLQLDATVADHARLLDGVAAPLAAADVAIVNLETPLLAQPVVDPTRPRPPAFHPAKEFVFASLPASARALHDVGVDVVGIGNNHLYDALEPGVTETLAALDAGGFGAGTGRAGGGHSESEAWAPAFVQARGTTVAVVACTTIDGVLTPPLYVAVGPTKGGAARCTDDGIRRAVAGARAGAGIVVMMIHGGYEYDRTGTERIHHFAAVAHDAGATLVVNHHPHVVGGFTSDASGLTAWTIGNLLFDQTVWPTFESYLLTVQVRAGRPIRAMVDPLVMDGFRPEPIVGDLAEHVARDAAGWEPGPFVVEDGAVEIADPATIGEARAPAVVNGASDGTILRLPGANALDGASVAGAVEAGRDLLWGGDFEDDEADGKPTSVPLWSTPNAGWQALHDAAAAGRTGVRLERTGANSDDAVLQPIHRIPVVAGTRLSFVASVRGSDAGADARVQLSWFNDLRGASSVQTIVTIPPGDGWHRIRVDITVPANAVAVLPLIRLGAPSAGRVTLDVDDLALIEWRPATAATLATDYVRVTGPATFDTVLRTLPGSIETPASPVVVSDGGGDRPPTPLDLPPGPSAPPDGED